MIRSALKRRGFASSSLVRLLDESEARSLRTVSTGVTSSTLSWTRESVLSRLGFLRSFSGTSYKQKISAGSSSDSNSESDFEDVLPSHADITMLLRSLNARQFLQYLKGLEEKKRPVTYQKLLKSAKEAGATSTLAESRVLCDAMFASGTIFRYGNRVYLDPDEIADLIRSVLPGTLEETEALIKKLEKEIEPTRKKKEELENKSSEVSNWVLGSGLGLGICAVPFMMWLTFKELSWDIMEPIAYFIALTLAVAFYGYYVVYRKDFQFSVVPTHIKKHYRKKYDIPDCSNYEVLKKQISVHRAFLARIKK